MTTAVDTNILLDILIPDEEFAAGSEHSLRQAREQGDVLISEPVYSELAAEFVAHYDLDRFLLQLRVDLSPSSRESFHFAGQAWARYLTARRPAFGCPQCGASVRVNCDACGTLVTRRQHVLADFMIGAHAQVHAGRLLTRDRGYYATYFPDLVLV